MRLSRYFLPVLREVPKEAEIVSHRLMLRAGLIRQQASGMYSWLPIGYRVLMKVKAIIEQEQDRSGAVELLMPTLQSADLWRESGRYDAYGKEMLRIKDRNERDMLYGPTNEEMITDIFRTFVKSYKDLPLNLYHVQWKFRDEIRPRFGTMRSREFLMKDAYSFDLDEASAVRAYHRMFVAYLRTFHRLGVTAIPMRADTGPIGGDLSHEFIILADTGESAVFCHADLLQKPIPAIDTDYRGDLSPIVADWTSLYAATEEMVDMAAFEAQVPEAKRLSARGIEVGHIFYFGTKYSAPMKATVTGPDGKEVTVHMGSYGIGPTRVVPAIIEASHDEAGIVWPVSVAPFEAVVINLKSGDADSDAASEKLYGELQNAGIDALYDDTEQGAGAKFSTADLIGVPYQLIVGPRGLKSGEVEIKHRKSGERETLPIGAAVERLRGLIEPQRRDKV
ncbi:proline--tRNA ligase [Paradevosia shaoguanensis]|uniref:Proline--tRNA ligase n=1 Tax=Paradevosia shaoguanensis TaxID=1335043 RepID=A0AA41UB12_9HYPH|nr:proline--tRNA ligase [Paradevosia shaoguanensis]MCF1742412.1 proline--tRNA ligase [Paradevosia shaoguanensis]MCI0126895.1 proline--tRNA ligase [Paradevosia shaoguanensis]